MPASKSWIEETAKEIIWEVEQLLCENDIKINNKDPNKNKFESDDSYINIEDYGNLKKEIVKQLIDFEDYIDYMREDAA